MVPLGGLIQRICHASSNGSKIRSVVPYRLPGCCQPGAKPAVLGGVIHTSWTARPSRTQAKRISHSLRWMDPSNRYDKVSVDHSPTNWPYRLSLEANSSAGALETRASANVESTDIHTS